MKNYKFNTTTITAVIVFLLIGLGTQCWAMLERASVQPENLHDVQKGAARMAWWRMNEGGPALRSHELSEGVGGTPEMIKEIIVTAHDQAATALGPDSYSRVPAAAGAEENVLKQLTYATRRQTSAEVNNLLGADAEVKTRRINLYNFYDSEKETVWTLAARLWKKELLETLLSNLTTRAKDLAVVKAAQGDGGAAQTETLQLLFINGAREWAAHDIARQLHLGTAVKKRIHDAWTPELRSKVIVALFRDAIRNLNENVFLLLLKTPEVTQAIRIDEDSALALAVGALNQQVYFPGSDDDETRNRIVQKFLATYPKLHDKPIKELPQEAKAPAEEEASVPPPFRDVFGRYKDAQEAYNYALARTIKAQLIADLGNLAKDECPVCDKCTVCQENILNTPDGIAPRETFDIIVLLCGHYMHVTCASNIKDPPQCPLCRALLIEDFIVSRKNAE
ncbi:MAG: RING finger protein [Candidatus Babeliales bacterium]